VIVAVLPSFNTRDTGATVGTSLRALTMKSASRLAVLNGVIPPRALTLTVLPALAPSLPSQT